MAHQKVRRRQQGRRPRRRSPRGSTTLHLIFWNKTGDFASCWSILRCLGNRLHCSYSIIWKGIFMKNKVHWINSLAIFELSKSENISLFPFSFRNRKRPNTTYADTSHACERCEWHQMLPESSAWLYKQLANNMWRLQRQRERCRYKYIMWSWKTTENVWHLTKLEIKWKRSSRKSIVFGRAPADFQFLQCEERIKTF